MKDTTSPIHKTFNWQCLCAYLLLAFMIVLGLYAGLNWQLKSSVDSALPQQLSQAPEIRVALWLFALAFLTIFASTVILHHVFVGMALRRLADTMGRELSQDMTEQASSPLPDETRNDSNFLASVSHDIRTRMNGIIGITNKLLETSLNHDQQQDMMMIQEATYALTNIMDNLLDLSNLETQQVELEDIPFSLIETIESCLDLLTEQARSKQLAFYCCVMSGVPQHVRGDARRVGQVLHNLLAKAIKSTDAGTVAISVSSEFEGDDRVYLTFEVYDTATDTDADMSPNFAKTSQTDVVPPQACGDTALGLIISQHLVEVMQGSIDMQSLPGKGTIWRFGVSVGHVPDPGACATPLPFHHMQVLYVDSSELNRMLLSNQFASWGMVPTTIADASAVISVLKTAIQQENPFPLIVIRHDPPTLDGYALCREIRRSEVATATKMLLLTAIDEEANPLASDVPRFDLSLTFPIRATALHHALRQLVDLPLATVSTCQQTSPQSAGQAPSTAVLNILLVEDNRVNQQVALAMLKKWGYRIDVAWNGLEALEAVQRQDYDLVLMDIQMPEMDGITTTQKIRQLDGDCAFVPIVAVTANAMQGDRERMLAAGLDDYIAKPIDRETFQRVVSHYASQAHRAQTERPEEKTEAETGAPLLGDEVLSYLLHELSGELVSELIDEYMTHSTDLLSQALVASEEQDAKNVEYAVHTLKGMSGALGAIRMVDICQDILETCHNQWTQQIEHHMNDLSDITEETQQALQAWRSKHESC